MVKEDAKTIINRLKSSRIERGFFSGARINKAERYWARTIIGILYPRTTENKLTNFSTKTLFFLIDIFKTGKRFPIYNLLMQFLLFLSLE
jgi:hypothetical protein